MVGITARTSESRAASHAIPLDRLRVATRSLAVADITIRVEFPAIQRGDAQAGLTHARPRPRAGMIATRDERARLVATSAQMTAAANLSPSGTNSVTSSAREPGSSARELDSAAPKLGSAMTELVSTLPEFNYVFAEIRSRGARTRSRGK